MKHPPTGTTVNMAYWLMKSEPDCYSIDDLQRDGSNMWEGCRNYTVRNFFRDKFKPGDLALFYHSSTVPPGIAGIMEIVSAGYPDPTQFDPKSEYFDSKASNETPRWITVDVRFVRKIEPLIPLQKLRETIGLEAMGVVQRGQRLSVMPVTIGEWKIIESLF